jgi:hypothetical protein
MPLGKKKKEEIPLKIETPDEELIAYLGIQGFKVPEGYTQIESYPLNPPFSYAWVFQDESEGSYFYVVDELPMLKPNVMHTNNLRVYWNSNSKRHD